MATKIRFKRIGRRNRPFYRLVVIDSRKRRDGAPIEQLGWYDPIKADKESNFNFNEDRIIDWLKEGAQVSDPVNKLMKRSGLAYRWHLIKQGLSESEIEKINNFVDVSTTTGYADDLDLGHKLAGQVTQEIKLPSKIINDG